MDQTMDTNQTEPQRETLDLRNQSSVWSILRILRSLREMPPQGLVEVKATDPNLPTLLPAVLTSRGGSLESQESDDGFFRLFIRKGGDPSPKRHKSTNQ